MSHCWIDCGWNFSELATLLPSEILADINAIYLRTENEAEDKLLWNLTPSGNFTIQSAFSIVSQGGGNLVDTNDIRKIYR